MRCRLGHQPALRLSSMNTREPPSLLQHPLVSCRTILLSTLLQMGTKNVQQPIHWNRCDQTIAKMANRVFIERLIAKAPVQKPQPRQPIIHHELGNFIAQIMPRLQTQNLEHQYRIKRRAIFVRTFAIAKTLYQMGAEVLKIDRFSNPIQPIASTIQSPKTFLKTKKILWIYNVPLRIQSTLTQGITD